MKVDYQRTPNRKGKPELAVAMVPWAKSFTLSVYVPVGSRHEHSDNNGLSHFIEHMVFKGSEKYTALEITSCIESVGGSINAYTTEDHTVYEVRLPQSFAEKGVEVLSQMLWSPTFLEEDMALEKEVVIEEIQMYEQNPQDRINDLASMSLWGNHPLGLPIAGTSDLIKTFDRKTVVDFWREFYFSENVVISVASSMNQEVVMAMLDRYLPKVEKRSVPTVSWLDKPSLQHQTHLMETSGEGGQVQLCYSFHAPGRVNADGRTAARLLSVILGETMSSRLFYEIREKRGFCYNVYSELCCFEETSGFFIYLSMDESKLDDAVKCLETEIQKIRQHGVLEEELKNAQAYLTGQFEMQFESPSAYGAWLAEGILFGLPVGSPNQVKDEILSVSLELLCKTAQEIFNQEPSIARISDRD